MRFSGWWLVVVVGCTGSTVVPDADDDDDVAPNDDSFVLPPPSNRLDIDRFALVGAAVWDPEEEVFLGIAEGEENPAQPPGILFTVFDSQSGAGCLVFLTSTEDTIEPSQSPWIEESQSILGFELLPGQTSVVDGCAGADIPDEFNGDVGGLIAKWRWGFGMAELDQEVREFLSNGLNPSEWDALEPLLGGAVLYSDVLAFTNLESEIFVQGLGRGYGVDENGAIAVNGLGERIDLTFEDFVEGADELARGYYEFDPAITVATSVLFREVPDDETGFTGDTGATP